jgi:uncharacterized protein YkwD
LLVAGLLACAGALVVEPLAARASSGCANRGLHPDAANALAVEQATMCLIDRVRSRHGRRALRANRQLGGVAQSQVSSMLRWNYFADLRPSGQTPLALVAGTRYRTHARFIAVGQNIAWASGRAATPQHIVAEWMASPPHRAIILSGEFRDAGVAVMPALPSELGAGSRGALWVVELGVRRR